MKKTTLQVIDFENHFYTNYILDDFARRSEVPIYYPDTTKIRYVESAKYPPCEVVMGNLLEKAVTLGEERINQFAPSGIHKAVISCSPGPEMIVGQGGIDLCKKINDTVYEAMQMYPDFYYGSMVLPVYNIEASIEEMVRCKEHGFVCWHTHSNYNAGSEDTSLDDPYYLPLLEKAAELGLYVYLHPQVSNIGRLLKYGYMFNAAGLGFTVDTQITILGMIINGTFDKIPNLKVVLGHLGEALPFLLERMDSRFAVPFFKEFHKNQKTVSEYFGRNIMVSTSGNYSVEAFELTKNLIGIDSIVVGSDYPYETVEDNVEFLSKLSLTDEEREKLYYQNGLKLLGIE